MKVSSTVADKHIFKKKKIEQLPRNHTEKIVVKLKECQNSMQHIQEHQILPAGCRWSTSNWSCAYDSFFMVFFYLHLFAPEMWRLLWQEYSPLSFTLHEYFKSLTIDNNQSHRAEFDNYRDLFRDTLTSLHSLLLLHRGSVVIDVSDIFQQLNKNCRQERSVTLQSRCTTTLSYAHLITHHFTPFFAPPTIKWQSK
jgi:hypothetical protein